MNNEFRQLPSVDKVLSDDRLSELKKEYSHDLILGLVRETLINAQHAIRSGGKNPGYDAIVEEVIQQLKCLAVSGLQRVINATGVVLHTNLGRAPLSDDALKAMEAAGRGYSNLEFDLDSGRRGSRQAHIEPLLCRLTGAEAGMVVNSNAAAVLLGLMAIARRKEVIVSRGQAVEIGGGFRIPDVMRQSGAKLTEVGTTNCTYLADYERAITASTVGLLRVHSSNFKVVGFTNEVMINELGILARQKDLILMDDLGSGCFLDTVPFGLAAEPTVQQSVASGSGLIFFSGDKLVGGPQAGIIVGSKALVDKLKKHPLARAVRIDKNRLAGLAATLIHYLKGEATLKIPVWRMISTTVAELDRRAGNWAVAAGNIAQVIDGVSVVGGGSLPGATLPTRLLAITGLGSRIPGIMARLRASPTPVIGRVEEGSILFDPRTVLPEEDEILVAVLKGLAAAKK